MRSRSRVKRPGPPRAAHPPGQERLQKVLASAGIGSRRQCEELIQTGRVEVDKRTVTELGTRVDPAAQEIRVDGTPLPRTKLLYYAVHKPSGVVTTNRDPAGRPRVIDLVPRDERLFPVGRLDLNSEGLIVVTNDGELANLLTHPRYGVEKTYQVVVAGVPAPDVLIKLRTGVHLAEGLAHVSRVFVKSQHKNSAVLEMVLDEGRNREVRRLLARLGHKVLRLRRIALGPLRLGDMPPGSVRPLRKEEVRALKLDAENSSKKTSETNSTTSAGPPKPERSHVEPAQDTTRNGPAKLERSRPPRSRDASGAAPANLERSRPPRTREATSASPGKPEHFRAPHVRRPVNAAPRIPEGLSRGIDDDDDDTDVMPGTAPPERPRRPSRTPHVVNRVPRTPRSRPMQQGKKSGAASRKKEAAPARGAGRNDPRKIAAGKAPRKTKPLHRLRRGAKGG